MCVFVACSISKLIQKKQIHAKAVSENFLDNFAFIIAVLFFAFSTSKFMKKDNKAKKKFFKFEKRSKIIFQKRDAKKAHVVYVIVQNFMKFCTLV